MKGPTLTRLALFSDSGISTPMVMDFYVASDGSDVTQSLANQVKSKLYDNTSGRGYTLIKVGIKENLLAQARQQLWRSLADNHPELDSNGNTCEATPCDGIGKVDCLPRTCLHLQVLPCFRKLFGFMLGMQPDELVSTMDVPQYVPPGQDQSYMGLSVGKTKVVGLFCLTTQAVTPAHIKLSPGTLLLYDTAVLNRGDNLLIPNPETNPHPWLGLRIGFWPRNNDKFCLSEESEPSCLRQELFLHGHFGLYFQQSCFANETKIFHERQNFLQNERDSRYFVPNLAGKCTKISVPHFRQLFFDKNKKVLKWMHQSGNMAPSTLGKRKHTASDLEFNKENEPPHTVKKKSKMNSNDDDIMVCFKALETLPMKTSSPQKNISNQIFNELARAKEKNEESYPFTDLQEDINTAFDQIFNDVTTANEKDEDSYPLTNPACDLPVKPSSPQQDISAAFDQILSDATTKEKYEEPYPLTDFVYDSMYESSDEELDVVHAGDYHPAKQQLSFDSEYFDTDLELHKYISQENIAILKRKKNLSPLSQYVFCNIEGNNSKATLCHLQQVSKSKSEQQNRCFGYFQSIPDEVHEVRGAKTVYDMLRIMILGIGNVCGNKEMIHGQSSYTIKEAFEENINLMETDCNNDEKYTVIRLPGKMVEHKKTKCYFNAKEHQKFVAPMQYTLTGMSEDSLKAIEWNDQAKKLLGDTVHSFENCFPSLITDSLDKQDSDQIKRVCKVVKDICKKEQGRCNDKQAPVACHLLSIEEVLEKHDMGVKRITELCRSWIQNDCNDSTIKPQIIQVVREQLQMINMMQNNESMKWAYSACKMSPKDLFLHVICTKLEPFKKLVLAVKEYVQ